jgi:hypothetical protein
MISFTLNIPHDLELGDRIGVYVESVGGYFYIRRYVVEFFIPPIYKDFLLLQFPELEVVPYIY